MSSAEPQSADVGAVIDHIARSHDLVELVGARGGYVGLVLAELRRRTGRPLVVVAPDVRRAEELSLALRFFEAGGGSLDPVPVIESLSHAPFSGMSPPRLQVMDRTSTFFRLVHDLEVSAVVVCAEALIDRVIPRSVLSEVAELVVAGESLDREAFLHFLVHAGYHHVPAVEDPGTFATRGGIIDVYCPLYQNPVRIDLWGDQVDSVRFFDPTSQRSVAKLDELILGPARDILFRPETIARARTGIRALADAMNVPSSRSRAVVDDVESGILGVGMEDLLPAFYEHLDPLTELLPPDAYWIVDDPSRCATHIQDRWEDIRQRAERVRDRGGEFAFQAADLFLDGETVVGGLRARARCHLEALEVAGGSIPSERRWTFSALDNLDLRQEIQAATQAGQERVLAPLTRQVRRWREAGWAVIACAHRDGGVERLSGLMGHYGLKVERHAGSFHLERLPDLQRSASEVDLFVGDPGSGFRSPGHGLVILDEGEILGHRPRRRRRHARVSAEAALESWRDLNVGDVAVHLQHGLGRYLGLDKSVIDGIEVDFVVLEYAKNNKLFVPVDKLQLVSKHTPGEGATPALDTLGGAGWQRKTSRVRKAVRDIADKLVKLYAEREARPGHAFTPPEGYYARFEGSFPWEETEDQARTIDEVLTDMQRERPMDRLVCGDVGFGKTEVAMRAAFLAILDGKQVAVLVPTMVLAEQHRLTFERRMEGFPVAVECLSRERSAAEVRTIGERLEEGKIDVIIGTHKLLSDKLSFRDLGLLVIDEEHRFGVEHKELLKVHGPRVDVLTLTATPIPRTLNMAMSGLRDISLIQTPPVDRLAIRTLVSRPSEEVIGEAIRHELSRGGQVFFVHNRVGDIEEQAELVKRIVPEARVAIGHGQMRRGALEKVMLGFMRGEHQVLVCTTIIESGLDIPNANTILIDRADRLGMAQLYQLRGRVGRSTRRAICYLLVPEPRNLEGDARERISAIQQFTELGSGFSVASYDLDIRGSGDVLGADQAGHMQTVGYDTYMDMLKEAIAEIQETEEERRPRVDPELRVAIEARIPEAWLPDPPLRLRLYREMAGAETAEEVYQVLDGAVDRYGRAPVEMRRLTDLMALKLEAARCGFVFVGYNKGRLTLGVGEHGLLTPEVLTRFLSRPGNRYRLTPEMKLVRTVTSAEWDRGLETLRDALREIGNFL